MDPHAFDRLARTLAPAASRRRALGLFLAAALAPTTAAAKPAPAACMAIGKRCSQAAGADQAPANGKGKSKSKSESKSKRSGKHHPPSCSKCCSRFGAAGSDGKARCTCKGEGAQCANDSQCCGGQCKSGSCTGCHGTTVFCSDGCADLQTNNQHCGSCDTACAPGQRCVNGSCGCDATSCSTGCCDGTTCKRGTSPSACGTGGAACQTCDTGQRCDGTNCVCDATSCPQGCCTDATCQPGDTNAVCGTGGAACQNCVGNDVAPDCVDGACTCTSGVFCSGSAPSCCPHAKDVCDQNSQCCTPKTTCPGGADCGTVSDGCTGTVSCGECTAPDTCGGGAPGSPNVCGCTPKTCANDYRGLCGTFADGCGGSVACDCAAPQTCGGGGTPNVCGCTPKTCLQLGKSCGTVDDGCGGTVSCGECPSGTPACIDNVCQSCSAAPPGTSCTSPEGLTDQATCHTDGRCCVDRGRFAGGDPGQSCVSNNCCSKTCLISGGTPLGACL